jgi:hydrogenase maturation protease
MTDKAIQSIVILGLGNLLRRDEGLGVRAVQRLQERYLIPDSVQVIDGGTFGLELLSFVEAADVLLVVDAMLTEGPPGTLARLAGEEVPAYCSIKTSPHEISIPDLLAVATLRGSVPRNVVVLGMPPGIIELGWELSEPVAAHLDELLDAVVAEVRRYGVALIPRTAAHSQITAGEQGDSYA